MLIRNPINFVAIEGAECYSDYDSLWSRCDQNSLFRSTRHLKFITEQTGSCIKFVTQRDSSGELCAALPFAVKDGALGTVVNSLPFFGTCGGVVASSGFDQFEQLVAALLDYCRERKVASATIIDDWRRPYPVASLEANFASSRTNQFVDLRRRKEEVWAGYHYKTRNMVRKAQKLGVVGRWHADASQVRQLQRTHCENMAAIGGLAKSETFFSMLEKNSDTLGPMRIYVGALDGADVAFLLLFYCGDTVEYYMPAVTAAARSAQPLSAIIHMAIEDAIDDGYAFWNWGGTWLTQDSLRRFKIRWGSQETSYLYHTKLLDISVLRASRSEITSEYPGFYVVPYAALVSTT